MATVYLADDKKHYRAVALKVLLPGLAAFLGVERFLNLLQKALDAEECRQSGEEHLEGHGAVMLLVIGQVDGRHPTATQDAAQRVAIGERRGEIGRDLHGLVHAEKLRGF